MNPSTGLLAVLEPHRELVRVLQDLDRHADLDPKVAEARRLVQSRIAHVPEEELAATVVPALWSGYCGLWGWWWHHLVVNVGRGEAMLSSVDRAMDTVLSADAVTEMVKVAAERAGAEANAGRLAEARADIARVVEEYERGVTVNVPVPAIILVGGALLLGFAAGYAYSEYQHHHAHHPEHH